MKVKLIQITKKQARDWKCQITCSSVQRNSVIDDQFLLNEIFLNNKYFYSKYFQTEIPFKNFPYIYTAEYIVHIHSTLLFKII